MEPTYESVVVDAEDEATAESDVEAATDRFRKLMKATRTLTLLSTTVGVSTIVAAVGSSSGVGT